MFVRPSRVWILDSDRFWTDDSNRTRIGARRLKVQFLFTTIFLDRRACFGRQQPVLGLDGEQFYPDEDEANSTTFYLDTDKKQKKIL